MLLYSIFNGGLCSARLQAGMCSNPQCRPEGRRYKSASRNRVLASLLFSSGGYDGFVAARAARAAAARVDPQAFDLLVERGERNLKLFRRFGLIPPRVSEHVADDAALQLIHDLK